jgi:hypothetical protein
VPVIVHRGLAGSRPDGGFGFHDSVNYTSGSFLLIRDRIEFDGATTLAAYNGSDVDRRTVIQALHALQGSESDQPEVRIRVVDSVLELASRHTTLRFQRAGSLPRP